ncbi:bifunctional oligoribonuclease/PAP phosphatase NrnA [Desulfonatronospira sp. MSAO_Bac3]|uniref:DHH family phosphoesterase n=1 Tax=Desulfonatronospira sp. MSAO_Bac3 TaxID=2293857 RepID=UPI000FF67EE1|nr:bifunctional oligoribonuclease/PAP phosphatase NrnA [Desulfonatronospira sp. MSAO_Bac3]RQD75851.1 MAG: bifunctional oligoribonuclease/PAP phosphatase NrnA [Desulfonatronospira sp. MSAO_Bac3]
MIPVPSELTRALKTGDNFLVTSHVKPDGDSIGSMSAAGHILKSLGKKFVLYNESGLPGKYTWLDLPAKIHNRPPDNNFDWIVVLDSASPERPGEYIADRINQVPTINIDHHPDNPDFGSINWVDPGFSSVGEMMSLVARQLDLELKGPLAHGIYLAIVSDTGFFSFGNTTPGVLEVTAQMVRQGLDPGQINPLITNQWSVGRIRLHGLALQRSEFVDNGRIGIICITKDMLKNTGTGPEDCEGLVNMLLKVSGVKVACTLREDDEGGVKMSLRSAGQDDVSRIASHLGGGGHKNASGGIINAPLQEAREMVIAGARRSIQ